MKRFSIKTALFLGVLALMVASGCSSSSSSSSSTGITKFTFKASDNAPDINQITYMVDTVAGFITNFDSIAYTSNITKVVPLITLPYAASEIRINDAAWNQTDSIDVTSPFKLTIVAANKKSVKDYTVKINKHSVNPDSIVWKKINHNLPSEFSKGKVLYMGSCLIFVGEHTSGKQRIYTSRDCVSWSMVSESEPTIEINSLYATSGFSQKGRIYALSTSGSGIYTYNSTTGAFDECGVIEKFTGKEILGEYKDEILILAESEGVPAILSYKDGEVTEKVSSYPSSFPLAGGFATLLVKYDSETTANVESTFIIGGETVAGTFTSGVHATDNGWYWSNVLKIPPEEYFQKMSYSAAVQYLKTIYTFGGVTNSTLTQYANNLVSTDNGFTWKEPANYQKVPDEFTPKYGISAIASDDDNLYLLGGYTDAKIYTLDFYRGRARMADFIKQ